MARPSNTEARRAEIVEGLLEVMSAKGYERASVAEIARAAGLASGLVHYHFDSKQDILVALVERLAAAVRERYGAPDSSPRNQLLALVDAHLSLGEGSDPRAVAAWVVVGAEAVSQPEVREVYSAALAAVRDEIERHLGAWRAEEGLDPAGASAGSAAILSAIEGAYQISAAAPGLLPDGFAAPTIRALCEALATR